ncbi:predicted protein [Naegleria gruberi]|uniref:Predicted protein n=1 Tax=Naegleria gruberi TaxID=5762 RepID=D2W2U6_NAEGR|nr:uncharacterized protein NAEGRDRAFT_54276 [Naegleria gruberi]EFC36576.1 predicted protein [Naegleria gruberi]|eukprot:XP_002669320.1 predicted protein [Naegleria gruberi strain NEG-M]
MSKRKRQDFQNHDQLINSEEEISTNNNIDTEEEAKQKKFVKLQQEVFSDDVCFEIISMIDDSWFILNNCSLISKQFFNVIKERSKLVIKFDKKFTEKRIELLMKSQFMNSIVNVEFSRNLLGSIETTKFISEMKQLASLNISNNEIGDEEAKHLGEMKQLTSLDISNNLIGDEGLKFINEMKQLTSLDISNNLIDDEGLKYLSEMKQLTSLNISNNVISEGVKYLSEMK